MHRFFIEENIGESSKFKLPEDILRQIKNILKIKRGEKITIFDATGFDFISEYSGEDYVSIVEKLPNRREPERHIFLFQSILKKDKMEWIFQKGTEAGVYEFVPVLSSRSVKKDFNLLRAQKIIKEAAEQSGRGRIPGIREIMDFGEALEFVQKERVTGIIADPNSKKQLLEAMREPKIGIFIGPEGGFTEKEIAEAKECGFKAYSLGRLNLRSESAALVASWLMAQ
ncbi:hypothetical protein A3H65_01065 [Candidatus Giovannonibacteria bacterium RIFCSPLOWO2_02_FULL_45_14]|uniref:Ribosomal RNA small subunit methyltransferase E n=1 Tax=Candidatus Giovannonibacteria bacterium RIFCSPLOWO2_12_FULL_44_15 TaxID=1798364 RepID=A0A1F5Y057_9BACT|nr:MAG: hypothetical protein A3C75_01490 [Candidatus Giovannonibacteria bacterium RIFCSPHIGHO2_02_FULL_44_31]OGF76387.1 MAG: hypothetical protein A3E62_00595 [Candidatus Giovannonibacteria bacterium RIFCSPHIGHO2_12_FULL_44_29]OGF90931.1 MAG: hypothetical protein A3H65_01065 [Candidatus Giovannonibacteria bacterium RIFCSPLOWO2_02_FULL_45_14]OGF93450.1 MAG: hypothetical protein A3G54_04135 [Candidatus Giovannonibacteria bacterium RIFCSPLOWO2_12_FULL_44_15]